MSLVMLGVDPDKQSHTATALVTGSHQQLATCESRPARPGIGSCWHGPDSSPSGAGRSRTPAAWAST